MASKDFTLTQEYLHSLFNYKDGQLFWKISRFGASKNIPAGSITNRNYRVVYIDYKQYQLHKIIFLYHHGFYPKLIDHIDGNPANNKIENLREATYFQNAQNCKVYSTNTSGFKNVHLCNLTKKWRVVISINGKRLRLGYFKDLELADLVAQEARAKYHGIFARHS